MSLEQIDNTLQEYRDELLKYHKEMYDFHKVRVPLEIQAKCSAFHARAAWIRNTIIRSPQQKVIRFRIDELDPFISEVKNQQAIWSRYSAILKDEYEMTKGL